MDSGEREKIRTELKQRIKLINYDLENIDRRDPYRNDLYDDRNQLRKALESLNREEQWETEMEVLARSMPESYGGW